VQEKDRVAGVIAGAGPSPPNPPASTVGFNDAGWAVVDAPHDMLITGKHDPANSPTQGFLPRGEGWYRKHFTLPADWKGSSVWVRSAALVPAVSPSLF